MADIYVRGVETKIKASLLRLAGKKQKTKKPVLNKYCLDLFEQHTKKERASNGKS
jgi:hypothetical protein